MSGRAVHHIKLCPWKGLYGSVPFFFSPARSREGGVDEALFFLSDALVWLGKLFLPRPDTE